MKRLPGEVWGWTCFFVGVAAVAFGSGYYHLKPDDDRLVWDRLPVSHFTPFFFNVLLVIIAVHLCYGMVCNVFCRWLLLSLQLLPFLSLKGLMSERELFPLSLCFWLVLLALLIGGKSPHTVKCVASFLFFFLILIWSLWDCWFAMQIFWWPPSVCSSSVCSLYCHSANGYFVASNVHSFLVLALGSRFVFPFPLLLSSYIPKMKLLLWYLLADVDLCPCLQGFIF